MALGRGVLTFAGLVVATFVSEDAACVAAGLLVQRGQMSAGAAVGACAVGIFLGDAGLWALGRFGRRAAVHWPAVADRLLPGRTARVRDWLLCGVWGREVHLVDERLKYARSPAGANEPLSLWSNRWSTMPVPRLPQLRLPPPDERARLER